MKIKFCNHDFFLHHQGALLWPAERMLIVSDLHLEKGSHYAQRGYFLPPYDSIHTLRRLRQLCEITSCERVLILGDCFHDNYGYERLGIEEKELFHSLHAYDPIWIRGNHDADFIPERFEVYDEYKSHGLIFRHEAQSNEAGEISGHFHPKIDIRYKDAVLSRRCFIEDGRKLILPAFGAYTGGLSAKDPAINELFPHPPRIYALGDQKIYNLNIY